MNNDAIHSLLNTHNARNIRTAIGTTNIKFEMNDMISFLIDVKAHSLPLCVRPGFERNVLDRSLSPSDPRKGVLE